MKTFFVSSTFEDMQYERDIIHTKVIPSINSMAKQYGDSVDLCDMRWGIDTEKMDAEKSAIKILKVCLNAIDRCRPYMIVLLGYRYGWTPDVHSIESAVGEKGNFNIEDKNISITALEIEYGTLIVNFRKTEI